MRAKKQLFKISNKSETTLNSTQFRHFDQKEHDQSEFDKNQIQFKSSMNILMNFSNNQLIQYQSQKHINLICNQPFQHNTQNLKDVNNFYQELLSRNQIIKQSINLYKSNYQNYLYRKNKIAKLQKNKFFTKKKIENKSIIIKKSPIRQFLILSKPKQEYLKCNIDKENNLNIENQCIKKQKSISFIKQNNQKIIKETIQCKKVNLHSAFPFFHLKNIQQQNLRRISNHY